MANKLYEETYIQNIADAIREKTGNTDTYTVAEMADGIKSIVTSGEQNLLVYTGELTETILGSKVYFVVAKSDFLAEHRNDTSLFVRVEFDIAPTPYTLKKVWATNTLGFVAVADAIDNYQYTLRYDANGANNFNRIIYAINDLTDETVGVGRICITEDGELRVYSNSNSNYALRPSNYKVYIEW